MKWRKRVLYFLAYVVLMTLVICVIGLYLYRGTPRWYRPPPTDEQQIRDEANSADQKLLDLFSWAASVQAQQNRKLHGISSSDDAPVDSKTITLSDDEVNSFFSSWTWASDNDLGQRMSRYFTGGRVFFTGDGIILTGQSPTLGALVSAQFNASLDDQQNLRLSMGALRAGMLPIPQSAAAPYLQRLQVLIQEELEEEQPYAQVDRTMSGNGAALAVCWMKLLLAGLGAQPVGSTLILPFDLTHLDKGLAVRLTGITIQEGQITLTLEALDPSQRDTVFQELQQPGPSSP